MRSALDLHMHEHLCVHGPPHALHTCTHTHMLTPGMGDGVGAAGSACEVCWVWWAEEACAGGQTRAVGCAGSPGRLEAG